MKECKFCELEKGSFFLYKQEVFLKTVNTVYAKFYDGCIINAINLNNKRLCYVKGQTTVQSIENLL